MKPLIVSLAYRKIVNKNFAALYIFFKVCNILISHIIFLLRSTIYTLNNAVRINKYLWNANVAVMLF